MTPWLLDVIYIYTWCVETFNDCRKCTCLHSDARWNFTIFRDARVIYYVRWWMLRNSGFDRSRFNVLGVLSIFYYSSVENRTFWALVRSCLLCKEHKFKILESKIFSYIGRWIGLWRDKMWVVLKSHCNWLLLQTMVYTALSYVCVRNLIWITHDNVRQRRVPIIR